MRKEVQEDEQWRNLKRDIFMTVERHGTCYRDSYANFWCLEMRILRLPGGWIDGLPVERRDLIAGLTWTGK